MIKRCSVKPDVPWGLGACFGKAGKPYISERIRQLLFPMQLPANRHTHGLVQTKSVWFLFSAGQSGFKSPSDTLHPSTKAIFSTALSAAAAANLIRS